MKGDEAELVLGWLAGGFNERLTEEQRTVWLAELAGMDAQACTNVALAMTRSPGLRFPRIGDFKAAVRRHLHPEVPEVHGDATKFGGGETPRWVLIWQWMRHNGDWRGLPQQGSHRLDVVDETEYAALEARWREETDSGRLQPKWGPLTHAI